VQALALLLLAGPAVLTAGDGLEAAKADFMQRFPEYGYQGKIDELWAKVGIGFGMAWPMNSRRTRCSPVQQCAL